jgi:uncharacterized protein YbcV (DUF1398 family)
MFTIEQIMFTIEQIDDLHARLGSASSLAEFGRGLTALGVEQYNSYLADGHSEYFGQGGHRVVSPAVHEVLLVAETGQRETLSSTPAPARAGPVDLLRNVQGLAQSGIEKWTVDTGWMTMTFSDKAGIKMLVEQIS